VVMRRDRRAPNEKVAGVQARERDLAKWAGNRLPERTRRKVRGVADATRVQAKKRYKYNNTTGLF